MKTLTYQKAKNIQYPIIATIKYDGHQTRIEVANNQAKYITSGGHEYRPIDSKGNYVCHFSSLPDGVYLAERTATDGKLGDRKKCALKGSEGAKTSLNPIFNVFDYLRVDEWLSKDVQRPYIMRKRQLDEILDRHDTLEPLPHVKLNNAEEVEEFIHHATKEGYEGLILNQPTYLYRFKPQRKKDHMKYKRQPTVDLLCIGTSEGEGKYVGMIGALQLVDSQGRQVSVGSGLTDEHRSLSPFHFIGTVQEIKYESMADTYQQPVFLHSRPDKSKEEID